ncbi:tyrosine-type recombinase/integrase [Clostridium pasteurianum]|uniref:Site-specific recombinase XerD n=1 Tax=Clostridium pasteurianum BC1 TaxID=86416 RepID=R4JZ72_CLOPA|nr:tyrosine-type recombinase/integrase [Clostridium pasteurianum]AGK95598.1 site-specific recombinase XerD [Clostridium pasteurianum BC1]
MKKRGNGEGTIYQRKDGRWSATFMVGTNQATGKPKRKTLYADSHSNLLEKIKKFKKDFERIDFTKDDLKLKDWMKAWLFEYKKNSLKPRSFQRYFGLYQNYIESSAIGVKKIKDLKAIELQRYINNLKTTSNNIRYIISLIKSSLNEAMKQDYIIKNPCDAVALPRVVPNRNRRFMTVEEQSRLTSYLKKHIDEGYNYLIYFTLSTGLRKGEVLGLEWSKVNLKNKTIYINKTYNIEAVYKDDKVIKYSKLLADTKNDEVRYVPIPDKIIPQLKKRHSLYLKDKAKNSKKYNKLELVFPDEQGAFLDERKPLRAIKKIYKLLNIPTELTFHSLRHTYATRLYEKSGDLKVIQSLLGHIDIDTTEKIYVHVSEKKKKEVTSLLNDFL